MIESQTAIKQKKAARGFFKPKNRRLHIELKIKLIPYAIIKLLLFFASEFVHATNIEIAISKNRIFHTIGKTQFGGVKLDFTD